MYSRFAASRPVLWRPNVSRAAMNRRSVQPRSLLPFEQQRQASSRSSRPRSPPKEYREDPELGALREKLYDNPDFRDIDTEKLNRLYWSLREYAHQCGGRADYDEAQRAIVLSNRIGDEMKMRGSGGEGSVAFDSGDNSELARKWRKEFNEYDAETRKRLGEVDERHRMQRQEFERVWREDMPRKYRKPSTHLLQVKKIERSFAVSAQFEEAKRVHAEAAAIAAQERDQQQANLNRDYAVAKSKLEDKQRMERSQVEQARRDGRRILNVRYQQSKETAQNRSFVVEDRKKETLKGSRMADRSRTSLGNAYVTAYERSSTEDVLLDPLLPPNDPEMLEMERRRRLDVNKKKKDYHNQHAAATMAKVSLSQKYQSPKERGAKEAQEENTKSVETQMESSGSYEEEQQETPAPQEAEETPAAEDETRDDDEQEEDPQPEPTEDIAQEAEPNEEANEEAEPNEEANEEAADAQHSDRTEPTDEHEENNSEEAAPKVDKEVQKRHKHHH